MKTIFLFFSFGVPMFFPLTCSRDHDIDCSEFEYDISDIAGKYKAYQITINSWCESDTVNNVDSIIDSLDYEMQLNSDGTGKIYGPDTLAEIDWVVSNITDRYGKGSGGCYSEFWVWLQQGKIEYRGFTVSSYGMEYYLEDSSWNFKDCHREYWYSFRRTD